MSKLIIYTCPECGNDLQEICLASMPPQYKMQCLSCGWSYTKPQEPLEIERITFEPEQTTEDRPQGCKDCPYYINPDYTRCMECGKGE